MSRIQSGLIAIVLMVAGVAAIIGIAHLIGPAPIYTVLISTQPRNATLYLQRARIYEGRHAYASAIADFEKVVELEPENEYACNEVAWLLATCSDDRVRNGRAALGYATKACELSANRDPASLDTLAAAYAETGDFASAVNWENKSMAAPGFSQAEIADARTRLALYQAHHAFHGTN